MLTMFGGAPWSPLDNTGHIVPLGRMTFFEAGTVSKQDVFTDANGVVPATNPVILDAAGRIAVYLQAGPAYDVQFTDPDDELIWFQPSIIANAAAT